MSAIQVVYHVACSESEIKAQARAIAVEQTVEVPEVLLSDPYIRDHIVGRVEAITPVAHNVFSVAIAYNPALACKQLPQLLNLLYGNISIKTNIRMVDLKLPDSLLSGFAGPNYGLAGLRRLLGVYQRPLLATALKPRGSTPQQLAAIARAFVLGGGDIIKDDHNLADDNLNDFTARVTLCQEAVAAANAQTGRGALYFPNLAAPCEQFEAQVEIALRAGVRGILVAPFLLGLDTVRHLARKYSLALMSHPTFSGTFFQDKQHGMEPGILLGTFFRLAGVDISVFPNFGGRFTFSRPQCLDIAQRLRAPMGALLPAWPAPAGGMRIEDIGGMAETYGPDAVFICGGALLSHGQDLTAATRLLAGKVRESFGERLEAPQPRSDPVQAAQVDAGVIGHIPFEPTWNWTGRERVAYKGAGRIPFKDISRVELMGKHGEQAGFEVRYFEIQPGGFSSREKHRHVHCIMAARGVGQLAVGGRTYVLKPHDLAYVPPLAIHQLRNQGPEPFGFFCIVDRERDRPLDPGA